MRRSLALAGTAALVAGLIVTAYAERPVVHVLTVALPGGGIEQVRYTGDTPPRLVAPNDLRGRASAVATPPDAPFALFDRAAAMMGTQTTPGAAQLAAMAGAPAGTHATSISTTTVDGRTCTTRTDMTALGAGHQPRLVRTVSGDGCARATHVPGTPAPPVAPPRPARDTI